MGSFCAAGCPIHAPFRPNTRAAPGAARKTLQHVVRRAGGQPRADRKRGLLGGVFALRLHTVAPEELLHASGGIDDLLLTRKEWMARTADFHADLRLSCPSGILRPAGADDLGVNQLRMDSRFQLSRHSPNRGRCGRRGQAFGCPGWDGTQAAGPQTNENRAIRNRPILSNALHYHSRIISRKLEGLQMHSAKARQVPLTLPDTPFARPDCSADPARCRIEPDGRTPAHSLARPPRAPYGRSAQPAECPCPAG